ncbi:ABC transporter permease [Streptomyces albus subsp. chlorinus]|uniref:ABC transporter permease n=1 Tax=Streptomyces albus TaxID=1888 RepID=UPI00156EE1B6|nr:ABC transporter permease [Streptomyces albus]NSC25232.1 ABC transporter permease [Streptomyces albus subsp. chlorinus]
MLRTALRSVRAHSRRFLLCAVAVTLGVAFVSGSLLYTESVRTALKEAGSASLPDASVVVRADPDGAGTSPSGSAPRLDDGLLGRLRALPGAEAARGRAEGTAFVVGPDGELIGPRGAAGGVNFAAGPGGRDPRHPLTRGRPPRSAGEIALDAGTARRAGYHLGGRVRIVARGKTRTERLVGIVTAHDPRIVRGGTLTVFDTATARRYFAPGADAYTSLTLTARHGVTDERLAQQVRAALPPGVRADTREALERETSRARGDDGGKLASLLLSFGAVALLVGTFLVVNTFTMLSAARAREHALLRAIGASRRYVTRLVLTEAALVGAVAAALGHLLGVGVAAGLGRLFGATDGPPPPLRILSPLPLAAAFGVGVVITVLSAYIPARRAGSVPPVAALRTHEPAAPASLRRRNTAGAAVTVLGALLVAMTAGQDDPGLLTLAAGVLMTGLIVLLPWLTLGLTALVRRPLVRLTGLHGTLAVENARRNPRRAAATAAPLMIGLALISAATVAVGSLGRSTAASAESTMAADLRVAPVDFADLADGTAARISRLPDAAAVTSTAPVSVALRGGGYLAATAVDPRTVARVADLNVTEGSLGDLTRGVAVTRREARNHGWHLGSRVAGTVEGTGSRLSLPVVALYDGPGALTPVLMPRDALPRHAGTLPDAPRTDTVLVKAAPGRTAALKREIRRTLDNPALLVQDRADAGREAARPLKAFLGLTYAMLSLAVLIGALGVVNTMAMAVFERVREIGILRALGLDRARVAAVLRLESLLLSLLGAALGVVTGTILGAVALAGQSGVPVVLPWPRLGLFIGVAAVIGVLAALWPGRQAARVPLLRAVQTDTE